MADAIVSKSARVASTKGKRPIDNDPGEGTSGIAPHNKRSWGHMSPPLAHLEGTLSLPNLPRLPKPKRGGIRPLNGQSIRPSRRPKRRLLHPRGLILLPSRLLFLPLQVNLPHHKGILGHCLWMGQPSGLVPPADAALLFAPLSSEQPTPALTIIAEVHADPSVSFKPATSAMLPSSQAVSHVSPAVAALILDAICQGIGQVLQQRVSSEVSSYVECLSHS